MRMCWSRPWTENVFIIKEKPKDRERRGDGVGVMKDKKLKLEPDGCRDPSHTRWSMIHTI